MTRLLNNNQVKENFKALEVVSKLTPEIMEEIEKVLANKPDPFRDYVLLG